MSERTTPEMVPLWLVMFDDGRFFAGDGDYTEYLPLANIYRDAMKARRYAMLRGGNAMRIRLELDD